MNLSSSNVFTSHEVAELVQVSPSAVLRWIDQGLLEAFRTPGGHRRIRTPALLAFLRQHSMPVPLGLGASRTSVLVIDDQPVFMRSLARLLQQVAPRIDLEFAEGPVDGLLKVGTRRPEVVMLDAYMPGMDGVEVCTRIKAAPETASVRIIAVTGHASPELEARFRAAGAAAFLTKPLTSDSVLAALATVGALGDGAPLEPR